MAGLAGTTSRYRWVILGICWIAFMIAFMQRLSVGPLAPFLKEDLSLTATQLGSLVSAAAFGYMVMLVPAGWLVDKINMRWILLVGEVVGGIFVIAMSTVQTYGMGLVFMFLGGAGMGFVMPTTTKAVLVWFPLRERATAMGFKQTGLNVGGVIISSILPAMALALSWRYGFVGIGCLAIVIGIVSFILYKEMPSEISLATTESSQPVAPSIPPPSLKELFKGRDVWFLSLAGMCVSAVEFSVLAYFVLYLQEVLSFAVVTAGLFLALLQGGGAFGKPISGLISDRIFSGKRKAVYILLCAITGVICFVWAFLGQGSPLWMIGIFSAIVGLSAISWGGVHLTLIGEIAGKQLAGRAVGTSSILIMIGNVSGPMIFGYILDTTGSYQLAWQFLAVLAIFSVIFILFVREGRRRV